MALKIETYKITTNSGKVSTYFGHPLAFLTDEEKKELDSIGYTGKTTDGIKVSRVDYLNSLGKGTFTITCVRIDNGDFSEDFIISRVVEVENNKNHIKFCVTYTMRKPDGNLEDKYENFEEKELALQCYEKLLCDEKLYTANFCEVIETTG